MTIVELQRVDAGHWAMAEKAVADYWRLAREQGLAELVEEVLLGYALPTDGESGVWHLLILTHEDLLRKDACGFRRLALLEVALHRQLGDLPLQFTIENRHRFSATAKQVFKNIVPNIDIKLCSSRSAT